MGEVKIGSKGNHKISKICMDIIIIIQRILSVIINTIVNDIAIYPITVIFHHFGVKMSHIIICYKTYHQFISQYLKTK